VLAVVAIVRSSNRRHQRHLLLRLVRTILRVVANPNRPIGWKIFDALFLIADLYSPARYWSMMAVCPARTTIRCPGPLEDMPRRDPGGGKH
jgi:hypothetical protein